MKKTALLLFSICCIGISACNKSERSSAIYSEKFSLTNFQELADKVELDKEITAEDVTYLTNALKRLSFEKDSVVGKSVKELIESEMIYVKGFTKKSFMEISKISILRLNTKNVFVGVLPSTNPAGESVNNLYFEFDNKYTKPIKSISGEIIFFYRKDTLSEVTRLEPMPFNFAKEIRANAKDTLVFYHKHTAGDQISEIIRNNTNRLSGLLNITNVQF